VLHQIVQDHLETFLAVAARQRDGDGLPGFVERAFRDFLQCGALAGGFARLRCGDCGLDRLVAFSCKGRALCPSCGGGRMAERAAHLIDHVLPDVPVRQWVLSLPYRLRYLLAWNHDLCRAVVAVFLRAVFRVLRARACDHGEEDGRGGAVAVVQRFGGALNLNIHIHALVLDGVFARDAAGVVVFHPVRCISTLDVAEVLAAVEPGITRLVERRGLGQSEAEGGGSDAWAEDAPALAGLAAGSVQGTVALGCDRGRRVRRLGHRREPAEAPTPGACHAQWKGYDLHAGLVVPAGQRERLERVCRYALRPPVTSERLSVTDEGAVRLQLRQPWTDGTTHVEFDAVEFLGRLAVLVPRPRVNLILYYGVLGARAAWRSAAVPRATPEPTAAASMRQGAAAPAAAPGTTRPPRWSDLMRRSFGFEVLTCPRCGGRLRLIALIEEAAVVGRILRHLGLSTARPVPRPARAPPLFDAVPE
jgi:hypothetical protein